AAPARLAGLLVQHPELLELGQALGEGGGVAAAHDAAELVEPLGAVEQRVDDVQDPLLLEDLDALPRGAAPQVALRRGLAVAPVALYRRVAPQRRAAVVGRRRPAAQGPAALSLGHLEDCTTTPRNTV